MANHKSAIKRHRQSIKRRERNRLVKAEIRTLSKKVTQSKDTKDTTKGKAKTASKSTTDARAAARVAEKAIAKAAAKGIIHKRTAARKISRLTKQANAVTAAAS